VETNEILPSRRFPAPSPADEFRFGQMGLSGEVVLRLLHRAGRARSPREESEGRPNEPPGKCGTLVPRAKSRKGEPARTGRAG
jgi:hypothetical protein